MRPSGVTKHMGGGRHGSTQVASLSSWGQPSPSRIDLSPPWLSNAATRHG